MTHESYTSLNSAQQDVENVLQSASPVSRLDSEEIFEGIWAWDVPANRVYWSPRLYEMLGMTQEESPLSFEKVLDIVHPDDREALERIIQDSLMTGESFETEFRMAYGSKPFKDVQILGRTYLDAQKKPLRMSGLVVDVTERKKAQESEQKAKFNQTLAQQAERISKLEDVTISQRQEIDQQKAIETALKQSLKREKLTKRLIQLMSRSFNVEQILQIAAQAIGGFFEVDRCRVIRYEKEGPKITGLQLSAQYCRSEAIPSTKEIDVPLELVEFLKARPPKQHPLVFLNASSPEQFPSSIKSHLENHGIQSAFLIEIKYREMPFGWLALHQCTHPRLWTEPEVAFLEILVTHIGSALYQAELYQRESQAKLAAEEANRQKTKILSFVSHDFKNPLDSIKRFISILEKDQTEALSEKHRELIGYIAEGVIQLRYMVTDILDKARLEEGRINPVLERIELRPFINELKPIFNSMASQRNVQVNIEIQPKLVQINADPTHLRQILINLISNAIKYNRINGETFLRFSLSDNEQGVLIEVQDTGIGIPSEKMPQLFTEYYRADLSHIDLTEGTGLGLAFIKKLVELHGGTVTVESELGVGSTFKVWLPNIT
jgi:PAS domain S-box-containing protein